MLIPPTVLQKVARKKNLNFCSHEREEKFYRRVKRFFSVNRYYILALLNEKRFFLWLNYYDFCMLIKIVIHFFLTTGFSEFYMGIKL